MQLNKINISDLKFAEYNPRNMSDKEYSGLKASLKEFGVVDPIIVNKDFTIIGGHQRVRAWQELGNIDIDCIVLDLTKKQEKKLNVILNSQLISGTYDDEKLALILEEIKNDDNYEDLRLDELQPIGYGSDGGGEVGVDSLEEERTIVFKFSAEKYLEILERLQKAKNDLRLETNEEVLEDLLSDYV